MSDINGADLARINDTVDEIETALTWTREHARALRTLDPSEKRRRAARIIGLREEMHEIEGLIARVLSIVEPGEES